jgi:hypothetical protein
MIARRLNAIWSIRHNKLCLKLVVGQMIPKHKHVLNLDI